MGKTIDESQSTQQISWVEKLPAALDFSRRCGVFCTKDIRSIGFTTSARRNIEGLLGLVAGGLVSELACATYILFMIFQPLLKLLGLMEHIFESVQVHALVSLVFGKTYKKMFAGEKHIEKTPRRFVFSSSFLVKKAFKKWSLPLRSFLVFFFRPSGPLGLALDTMKPPSTRFAGGRRVRFGRWFGAAGDMGGLRRAMGA